MPLIQESVYVEIKDDYDGDDVFFVPPPPSWSLFLGVSHSKSTLSGRAQSHIGLLAPPLPPQTWEPATFGLPLLNRG